MPPDPNTPIPNTTAPNTTAPNTTAPNTMAPNTMAPNTMAPNTMAQPSLPGAGLVRPPGRRVALAGLLAAAALPRRARGEAPLRLVIGFIGRGTMEQLSLFCTGHLQRHLGRPVVLERLPGRAGLRAMEAILETRDGSALLLLPSSLFTLLPHALRPPGRVQPLAQFRPMLSLASISFALAVDARHPARDLDAFLERARMMHREVEIGIPALGSAPHFLSVLLARRNGLRFLPLPVPGVYQILAELAAGRMEAVMLPLSDAMQAHQAGEIRILAMSAQTPPPALAGVRTREAFGLREQDGVDRYGLFIGNHYTPEQHQLWREALHVLSQYPGFPAFLSGLMLTPELIPEEPFAALLQAESRIWERRVRETGFSVES
ncbi:tripartite tricarboxylate transporter substrate-binding protein [Roseomonas sp. GC11]|uniref:tripartite tricarboxylate transporter substrate-binding protein n=1 Tax=Roseomonas sp. GC11 TaxID=2950546 RepID=UPI00210AAE37|nr:tripartite tricarboxylate transporter substrate-binding protein [Roseomonas sp. GC11]MCQ4163009.1 tripartite tricarboxylate transporter substrate-binding protein [Roseomonas sp. GC11]